MYYADFQEIIALAYKIEANFRKINSWHKISLQGFLNFYNDYVANSKVLHEQVR